MKYTPLTVLPVKGVYFICKVPVNALSLLKEYEINLNFIDLSAEIGIIKFGLALNKSE